MAETVLKKLESQVNCLICLDTYTNPKQLECHHVYCQQCLVRLVINNQQGQLMLTCPTCRQITPVPANGVAGLQPAFLVNHLLDILKEHKKAKAYCAHHQERELELYCETCEELICFQCTITEHKAVNGHCYNLLSELFEKHKKEISASLSPVEDRLAAVGKALDHVDLRCREIFDQQATMEADICKDSQLLHEAIDIRKNRLISKLRFITQEKIKNLASQKDQLETELAHLSSCLSMMRDNLTMSSQAEIMKMKPAIHMQIEDLIVSLQRDPLEPVAKADMRFITNKKVVQVCQTHGQVVALGSPDPDGFRVTSRAVQVAVGEKSTAVIEAINFRGEPCEDSITTAECELVSDLTRTRARGTIERRGQSEYEISYQPTIKGRHQLHVKVEGRHISGSPFCVVAKSSIEKLGTPILTVGGMKTPIDVAVNQKGEMVVIETDRHCFSVFSPSGEKIQSFASRGSAQDQLYHPYGLAVDGEGNILVVDCWNHRIQKFTPAGQFLVAVGAWGEGPLQLMHPVSIAVHSKNNKVYIGDYENDRIQVLNSDLTFSYAFGMSGSGDGQFNSPAGIAFDSAGKVYVADSENNRIQVFTAEGKFLKIFGGHGEVRRKLNCPAGIAIDSNDMIYVSEISKHCVSVFTSEGQFVKSFGKKGKGPGEFRSPHGLAVTMNGVVYVCDTDNDRVVLY